MFDFTDQKILVPGGSSGIGLATAKLAVALGGHVTIASCTGDKINAAKNLVHARIRLSLRAAARYR